MNKEAPRRKSLLLWKLVTALVSILLLLGVAEVCARVGLGVQPKIERFQLDPDLGWEWTPGYDTVETYHGVSYRMRISSQSLRNEEIVVPKPADTYRIIVLGDSITEGPGVEMEGTFSKLLERSLRDVHAGRSMEVINAGTGDYGTEQERIWLETRGLLYQPDLVVLDVYLNDWRDFSRPPALVAFFGLPGRRRDPPFRLRLRPPGRGAARGGGLRPADPRQPDGPDLPGGLSGHDVCPGFPRPGDPPWVGRVFSS